MPLPQQDDRYYEDIVLSSLNHGDDLEREMQEKMEVASVSESVDSGRYSYRASRSLAEDDPLAMSGRGVMDESYSAHLKATAAKWGRFQSKEDTEEEISLSGSRATLDCESERSGISSSVNSKSIRSQRFRGKDDNHQLPKKEEVWEHKHQSKLDMPREPDLLGLGDALQPLGDNDTKNRGCEREKQENDNHDEAPHKEESKPTSLLDLSHNDSTEECWKDESELHSIEQKEWSRKKKVRWLAIAAGLVALLAAALFGFGILFGRKNPTTNESSGVPDCKNLPQQSDGRFDLILQNVTTDEIQEHMQDLENLVLRTYNSASGGCEGLMARVVTSASMIEVEPLDSGVLTETSPLISTSWRMSVKCLSCPDEEPLFARVEDYQVRNLQSPGPYKNSFPLYEAPPESMDMLRRFLDTFNRLLPTALDVESALVVTLATLTEDGEVHQAMDWPLLPAEPITAPPSMAPSEMECCVGYAWGDRDGLVRCESDEDGEEEDCCKVCGDNPEPLPCCATPQVGEQVGTERCVGDNCCSICEMLDLDQVDFTFSLLNVYWNVMEEYEDIQTGMTINKNLLHGRYIQFRVATSSPDIPGIILSWFYGTTPLRQLTKINLPWVLNKVRISRLSTSFDYTTNETKAYTLTATPIWFETSPFFNITRMGEPHSVSFFVDDARPTVAPSPHPTGTPTSSAAPSISSQPTAPTAAPTIEPTMRPTSSASPTSSPSASPTRFICRTETFKLVNSNTGDIIREVRDGDTINWSQLSDNDITNVTIFANTIPEEVALVRWYENGQLAPSWGKYLDGVLWDGRLGASELLATPTGKAGLRIRADCKIAVGNRKQKSGVSYWVKLNVVR